ncbi:MAG: S-layer homology domain-containing protein [bacterium]|nr:S-layer homology domain-containing protein [bacterium]MDE0233985.1 S-layer homology domain-containing protein [bacterium]
MNSDGTGERQLGGLNNGHPTWSPDGTQIAFEGYRGGEPEIFVMNVDGTGGRQLTSNSHPDGYPSWSPDGTQIAFTSVRNDRLEVFAMDADGANQRQLTSATDNTPGVLWSRGVSWSPDGAQVVYNRDLTVSQMFVANRDGSNPRQLSHGFAHTAVFSQGWSSRTAGLGSDLFEDVSVGHDADRSIGWALTNGITSGIGQGQFGPGGTVTRAQIVTFLHRTVNLLE